VGRNIFLPPIFLPNSTTFCRSSQRRGRAVPDKPQGVQSEPGLLQGTRQLCLLCLGQPDFLGPNVVVYLRQCLQPLDLVTEQVVHLRQRRTTQCVRFGFGQLRTGVEHRRHCPAGNLGILNELVWGTLLELSFPTRAATSL
jgi:hypothetical protein